MEAQRKALSFKGQNIYIGIDMDRRKFIKIGAGAAAAGAMFKSMVLQAAEGSVRHEALNGLTARCSTTRNSVTGVSAAEYSSESGEAGKGDLLVRFLGTGAADWNGIDERGELRRLSSVLLDNRILIDFTPSDTDMLPAGFKRPDAIFYTHSHSDHYNAKAAIETLNAGVVYAGDTWIERAKADLAAAASGLGKPAPKVAGLAIGQRTQCGDITITALPGNHATKDDNEQTLIYLIEKGSVRVLYATDTGGIPVRAARIVGIDAHIAGGKPITGLIMEATMGIGHDEDFRIYTHSSVGTVLRTAHVLQSTGRLNAPQGQPVYITHLARTLHGTQAQLDADLPSPLRAAYDGLEVIFRG